VLTLPECKLVFLCGPVASGKTFLIKTWLARDNRHVVFDGSGEFMGDPEHEQIWANPKALHARLRANPYFYKIAYQPGLDREEDFAWVLKAMWWIEQPKLLVCDEFHEICPVEYRPPEVEMMLRFARHDKLGFVGASQRIADVNKLYTSACRLVILFQTNEARDLEAAEDRWGCGRQLEALRPLLHDDVTGVTRQVPQCLVIEKGQRPYVYDFQTESRVESAREREGNRESPEQRGSPGGTGEIDSSEDAISEAPDAGSGDRGLADDSLGDITK